MSLVPVADPQTAEELYEHYKRVRARLDNPGVFKASKPKPVVRIRLLPPPLDLPETADNRRTAQRVSDALRALDYVPGSRKHARLIVRRYADEHGVSPQEVLMPSRVERQWVLGARRAAIVQARHKAMAGVYTACKWPVLRIGNFFGGRDHTTVLYALYKLGAKQPVRRQSRKRIPLNVVGSIVQAMLAKGHERRPATRVAAQFGVNETSVRRIMRRYWKERSRLCA